MVAVLQADGLCRGYELPATTAQHENRGGEEAGRRRLRRGDGRQEQRVRLPGAVDGGGGDLAGVVEPVGEGERPPECRIDEGVEVGHGTALIEKRMSLGT